MSEQIDQFILRYSQFNSKLLSDTSAGKIIHPIRAKLSMQQRAVLEGELEELCRRAASIFDKKDKGKTLVMALKHCCAK